MELLYVSSYRTHESRNQSISLTCCPVVDVPVIARFINQAVILLQLLLTHCVQVSLCKKATEEQELLFHKGHLDIPVSES